MLSGAIKVAVVAIVVYKLFHVAVKFGVYTHFQKHYPGNCRQVPGIQFGSEDLQVTRDGLAFITSGLYFSSASAQFKEFQEKNNIDGKVYLYDFNKPNLGAQQLKLVASPQFDVATFRPHGLSLLEDLKGGQHLLYIINHILDGDDAVEKFRYLPKTKELVHLKSFTSDKFYITNDLALVGEDKFYISNFLYFKNYYLSIIEQLVLPIGLGSLVFYNGSDFTEVQSGLPSPNGVVLSKDQRYLYVNLPLNAGLSVYQIEADSSLSLVQSVNLHTGADNLHLSETGDALYTGTHPIFVRVAEHMVNPEVPAPSSVLRLPLKEGRVVTKEITELFYDHGELISGSSVAAVYQKKLLIGSVINTLVVCDVNVPIE